MAIPIIDIFAGPGGLGEGFSSLTDQQGHRYFKIVLSVEHDTYAHQTLTLRSFFRQFSIGDVPSDYYDLLKGKIQLDELYKKWPIQSTVAAQESWKATLGEGKEAVASATVDERIKSALNGRKDWVLIGGPPCQAYSIVGRNRRQELLLDESKDERVGLYKQYLRILAVHNPPVFVMENVKGLLSAETKESPVFSKILEDLADPIKANQTGAGENDGNQECPGYKIYSLTVKSDLDVEGNPIVKQKDFVIHAEKYGIPQTRHRVILLGVRRDIAAIPGILEEVSEVDISKVISDLPRLRGGLSKSADSNEAWRKTVNQIIDLAFVKQVDKLVYKELIKQIGKITLPQKGIGAEFISGKAIVPEYMPEWFSDIRIGGVCNHRARGHMKKDLFRYFFIACFAKVKKFTPQLDDLPKYLLPEHNNVYRADGSVTGKFPDRFRVQLKDRPAKTITSHISQDGHYYIHYDPTQCRSFTVREAARIQTFPDNYFFCGPRTSQFVQVGNAVPPLLANKIAHLVKDIFQTEELSVNNKVNQQIKQAGTHIANDSVSLIKPELKLNKVQVEP